MTERPAIRTATIADADAIAAIYAHYVRDSVITFEVDAPDAEEMAARIGRILPHYPFIVAECNGVLSGYAYAGRLYERPAYRWVAEATVYVAQDRHRRGIGRALYRSLIASLREQGFQAVVGKITLPNPASVTLHEAFGFVRSGVFTKVGFKHGKWHDVGLYQLDLGSRPTSPEETRPFA
jgi:L-amino acid N-acyltransferase YncA